jgi:hypothetical protein
VRTTPALPVELSSVLRRQEGAMTTAQALAAGLTRDQLRALTANGWQHPTRGVYLAPTPADPFRASVWGRFWSDPTASPVGRPRHACCSCGLPRWTPAEHPHLILPAGHTYNRFSGLVLHSGLQPHEKPTMDGLPLTTLDRTVTDMASVLELDDLVCLVDSALRAGLRLDPAPGMARRLRVALALADARSESTFETLLRLLFVRAGLAPETLQLELFEANGRVYARLDMAWPTVKVEADGREHHDAPHALYRDRVRGNALALAGWTVLRFTWADLVRRPEWIVEQVRRALNPEARVIRAS